jgi:uncharacterized protein
MEGGQSSRNLSPEDRRREERIRRARARRRRGLIRLAVLVAAIVLLIVLAASFIDCGSGSTKVPGTSASTGSKPDASASPLFTPSASRQLRLRNYGDSMGGEVGFALTPLARATKVIKPWTYYKVSSSLVKPEFFNWPAFLKTDLPKYPYLHAAVFMVGTNDGQGMVAGGKVLSFGTPSWRTEYARRIASVLAAFKVVGVQRVYWVGMPIMKSSAFGGVMATINQVAKAEVARHPGVRFVDTWKLMSTTDGSYDSQWRQSDGIHFNIDGTQRVANAVLAAVKSDWNIQ